VHKASDPQDRPMKTRQNPPFSVAEARVYSHSPDVTLRATTERSALPQYRSAERGSTSLRILPLIGAAALLVPIDRASGAPPDREQVVAAMKRAATFYREKVALRGGYVYYYSLDLRTRLAEGPATPTEICVQPPATPTVGMAYLSAHEATGDPFYLAAARETARSLAYGQLKSGGWSQTIDFDSRSQRAGQYRNGRGHPKGRIDSSFDDGQSQSAMRFMIHCDEALAFRDKAIHESALYAMRALINAQFPNGGFPQVWDGPVSKPPVIKASFPRYDWRTEGRFKNYWDYYTLNDGVAGHIAPVLIDARRIYGKDIYEIALRRLGDFLILAQMPEPQPAWAQQYGYHMHPIWARRFEPPAIAARESEDVMMTLMTIFNETGDRKYLAPIPAAVAWLKRSLLPDGRQARYHELENNKPLYMNRAPGTRNYFLTNSDKDLPDHYGWKNTPRVTQIEVRYNRLLKNGPTPEPKPTAAQLEPAVRKVVGELDSRGRWITRYAGQPLVGQPKFRRGDTFIASGVFSHNVETLADWLIATQ